MWEMRWVLRLMILACVPFLLPICAGAFCFDEAGDMYGIDPALLQAIARVESGMMPNATNANENGTVDLGLMQINSTWIRQMELRRDELISDPCYNVKTGARILSECIDKFNYTWQAVGCYNAVSERRKIEYSWKIYRVLKKEFVQNTNNLQKNLPFTAAQKNQYLYFNVRSTEGTTTRIDP
jgi:soluble lytic murein transglycosylase-like protein